MRAAMSPITPPRIPHIPPWDSSHSALEFRATPPAWASLHARARRSCCEALCCRGVRSGQEVSGGGEKKRQEERRAMKGLVKKEEDRGEERREKRIRWEERQRGGGGEEDDGGR
eukprot:729407-Hanusia_phi.AAC.3